MKKLYLITAAVSGLSVVLLGAFGAHVLKARLSPEWMQSYQTAVQYQMFHTLALLACGALLDTKIANAALTLAGSLFLLGILLFSGSLYLLALTGLRWLGAITPLGGIAWIAAWLSLLYGVRRS